MKKGNMKMKLIFILTMVLQAFCMPSMVYAENEVYTITYSSQTKTYSSKKQTTPVKGTFDEPIHIDLNYDEVIVSFGNNTDDAKFETPFHFVIVDGENTTAKYAKYTIDMIQSEKKIVFKRIATSDKLTDFYVLPDQKTTTENFVQPGAVYSGDVDYSLFTRPLYWIQSSFMFDKPNGNWNVGSGAGVDDSIKKIETVLGNTTLKDSKDATSGDAADRKTYVFAENGLTESQYVEFTNSQINRSKITVLIVEDVWWRKDGEKPRTYKATGKYSMQDIMSGDMKYDFSSTHPGYEARVIYTFDGLTSQVLSDNEVNGIEEILTKILLSIGSLFRAVVTKVGGQALTIDALIFNTYPKTMLDFWGTEGTYTDIFQVIINGWYNAFKVWSSVVLVVVLVAMGVKTLLYAGTTKEKKIQTMLVGWVLAVALLYLGPYFMKYAVLVNDSFVNVIRGQSEYSVYSVYNADFLSEYDMDFDLQYGEDSETVKLLETLQNLYTKIEANLDAASGEMKKALDSLNETNDKWTNIEKRPFIADVRIIQKGLDADGLPRMIQFEDAREQVSAYADNNPKFTSGDINEFLTSEEWLAIEKVDFVGEEGALGDLGEFFREGLLDQDTKWTVQLLEDLHAYADAKRDFNKYEQQLKATEKAMEMANKGIDLESQMKERAGETYRIVYVLIWYLMIYQLVLLMFLYYKRLIVTAVLITIYPLVVMMYAIEKLMGIESSQTLKIWLTEFLVNIFIQAVHALLYVMLIEAGLRAFEEDPDNWLFFVMAVLAIFPMEGIVKSILGMKSSSVSGLKESSKRTLATATAAAIAVKSIAGSHKNIENKYKAQQQKADQKAERQDKLRELGRKTQDNHIMRKYGGASSADAQARLEQYKEKREAQDATRKKKRDASKRARDRRKVLAHSIQPLKDLAALSSLATNFMALGGDPEDVPVAAAVGKIISGNSKKHANVSKTETSSSNTKTTNGQAKDRYQESRNKGNGQQGSSQKTTNTGGKPGQPKSAPNYKNGRTTPTWGEKRSEDRKSKSSMELQNKYRTRLAGMKVNVNPPQTEVNEDTSNSTAE